ncbi:MAG: cytochrome c oxidase assembly protein [Dehalococcoidia bacterium]|nr:cytochrome c oxidase assembly protein [Dehalococcoidia bacterium]
MLTIPVPSGAPVALPSHDVIAEGADWWTAWNFDVQYLIPVAVLAFLYARGLTRWENRGRYHSPWRTVSYYTGIVLLVLIYESPLDRLGEHHFSMHMIQHNISMMIIPPLIYLGAPATPVLRGLPRGFRKQVVSPVLRSPVMRAFWGFLTHPVVAVVLFAASQWIWHLGPGYYDLALRDDLVHDIQHISFFAVAMIFWWNIVDPKPRRSRIRSMGLRIVYFYGAMVPKHILAAFITFADAPFYPTYERVRLFLPGTPLQDQQLAGLLMWVPFGEALNLTVAGIIFAIWWRQSDQRQREAEAAREAAREAERAMAATPGA